MLQRATSRIFRVVEVITIVLVGVMVVDVTLQIVFRYLIGKSMYWTEEVGRYTLVWLVFLAASMAVRKKKHIDVDFVVTTLNPRAQVIVGAFGVCCIFLCAAVFVFYGAQMMTVTMMQQSAALHIPMGYMYMAIPVCGALILIHMFFGSKDS